MTGPPAHERTSSTAPTTNRAQHTEVLIRMFNGDPVCRVAANLAEELVNRGEANSFRNGPRRYLRLKPGIFIKPTLRGWELVEEARRQHGDTAVRRGFQALDRRPLRWEGPRNAVAQRRPNQEPDAMPAEGVLGGSSPEQVQGLVGDCREIEVQLEAETHAPAVHEL
jgi:hypothetical protein